jgi:hypothetical protein
VRLAPEPLLRPEALAVVFDFALEPLRDAPEPLLEAAFALALEGLRVAERVARAAAACPPLPFELAFEVFARDWRLLSPLVSEPCVAVAMTILPQPVFQY